MKKMHIYNTSSLVPKMNKDVKYLTVSQYIKIAKKIACHLYKYNQFVLSLIKDPDILAYLAEAVMIADGTYDKSRNTKLGTWRCLNVVFAFSTINKRKKKAKFHYGEEYSDIKYLTLNSSHYHNAIPMEKCDEDTNNTNDIVYQLLDKTDLNPKQKLCVELRLERKTFREIGEIMNMTKQRAAQIYDQAIKKMSCTPYEE